MKDKSGVLCECMELRSSSPSWPRSRMMLDEQGASRRGSPGVGSPATGRHLKPRHRKIPVSEHRSRTREQKSVHYTHRPIPDVVRRSRGPFTHLCRAERECKSAKVVLSPAQTTVLSFRCWSERKVVLDCLCRRSRRGLVCIGRGDSCCVSRVLSSPPSPVFVRRRLYVPGIRLGSTGFPGGPSYQAGI